MSRLTELQEHLSNLKQLVIQKNKVEELQRNPVYIEIIEQGFLTEEMQRYSSLAVSEKATPDLRALANDSAKSGAVLLNYLTTIVMQGRYAEEAIPEVEEAIVEEETTKEDE